MTRFVIATAVLMTGLYSAIFLGVKFRWFAAVPSYTREIILFLGISTLIIFRFLIKVSSAHSFTQGYLLSIVLKLLLCGTFIFVIIFLDKPGAFGNALLFIVGYVLFTSLEVGFLFKRINSR